MKRIWIVLCTLLGAAIGALLISFLKDSTFLTVLGGLGGAGLGWAFGRFVPITLFADIFG